MVKRCVFSILLVLFFVLFSSLVFGAGGTHTANEIKGGTFAEKSAYSVGTATDNQLLTLYQTGTNSISVYSYNKNSGGIGIQGEAIRPGDNTNIGVFGTSNAGIGIAGSSASGVGVEGVTTSGYSGYFSGGKFMVVNAGESTTQSELKGKLDNAGVIVSTDYTSDAFTPGFFWQTGNNNAAKPKAGIYLKETGAGTYMYFGTSNDYSVGITNNGLVIDPSGNVAVLGSVSGASVSVTGTISDSSEGSNIVLGCVGTSCWTNANGIIGFRGNGIRHGEIAYYPDSNAFSLVDSSAGDPAGDYGALASVTKADLYVKDLHSSSVCIGADCRSAWPVATDTDNYVDSVAVTGTSTKTVTIGRTGSLADLTTTFTDQGITAESDPQVGTTTANRLCKANSAGTGLDCTVPRARFRVGVATSRAIPNNGLYRLYWTRLSSTNGGDQFNAFDGFQISGWGTPGEDWNVQPQQDGFYYLGAQITWSANNDGYRKMRLVRVGTGDCDASIGHAHPATGSYACTPWVGGTSPNSVGIHRDCWHYSGSGYLTSPTDPDINYMNANGWSCYNVIAESVINPVVGEPTSQQIFTLFPAKAGDQLFVEVMQNSGSTLTISPWSEAGPVFFGWRVGDDTAIP